MGSEAQFGHGQNDRLPGRTGHRKQTSTGDHGTAEPIQLHSQHCHRQAAGEATKLPKNHNIFQGRLAQ